jgi:spore coat protein A, manganese oxidase
MKILRRGVGLLVILLVSAGTVCASDLVRQRALPGDCIPQFAVELPVFGPAGSLPRVDAVKHPALAVTMKEVEQVVLPLGQRDTCGLGVRFQPTTVWAYETTDATTGKILGPAHWPAVTLDTKRSVPTVVTYVNKLPSFLQGGLIQGLLTVDQTIHWADPFGTMMNCMDNPAYPGCARPFVGAPPSVPHLHGAEIPSAFDGGPNAWFTADGKTGAGYQTIGHPGPGKATYRYANTQEPGTLWFHDHALGMTRTNVYSGLEAFYFIRDASSEPANLPDGPYEIEMAIQDRQFDTHSQLFFPDGSGKDVATSNLNGPPTNPNVHPFWNPEFIGDVAIVNGAPWPYLNVEPRRYRFRLLDGSNARMYNLTFGTAPVYVIGSDDAYLNRPVKVDTVFIAPGERYDLIVDFSHLAGQTVTVTNDAMVPYPDGLAPGVDQPGMAKIMQFRVSRAAVHDPSCNPALGGCKRPDPIARLTDGNGQVAPGVTIDRKRQLILKEHAGPGGPLFVAVNNTKFDGLESPRIAQDFPKDGVSEKPRVGSVELWEIINLTADAHPMHIHLAQWQILNRESFDVDGTQGSGIPGGYIGFDDGQGTQIPGAWPKAFGPPCLSDNPAINYDPVNDPFNRCPGAGPPRHYNVPNADGAIGGNPAISRFLLHDATPPAPEESGWKDMAKAYPGQVLRLLVRWTPTSTPVTPHKSLAGVNLYPFDPTDGPGYVWHCHILDHEDNDMMRPYTVTK